MPLYLLLKEHRITGLKYLCKHEAQSFSDCEKYSGSGIYWKHHLSLHGNNVKTTCLFVTENVKEFKTVALDYSLKFGVIHSDKWANLCNEQGQGGDTIVNKKIFAKLMKDKWQSLPSDIREKRLFSLRENIKKIHAIGSSVAKEKLTGVPKTEEHKQHMRGKRPHVNQSGNKNNNARKIRTPYGIFESIRDAEEVLKSKGYSYRTIWTRIQKDNEWGYCND